MDSLKECNIKKLIRRVEFNMYNSSVDKVLEAARILGVREPKILVNNNAPKRALESAFKKLIRRIINLLYNSNEKTLCTVARVFNVKVPKCLQDVPEINLDN